MNYRIDHIPVNTPNKRRSGLIMLARTITIHNTGNPSSNAAGERAWLTNPSNERQASFHIVVDEREAVECIPLNENAWHAGDGSKATSGNRTSIGIEICESGDYAKTLDNAAELVASMLKARGWGVDQLRRHYDWSGKICPRLMYDGGKWTGWTEFKALVRTKLQEDEDVMIDKAKVVINGKPFIGGVVIKGTTYIPLRAAAEVFEATVGWDGVTKTSTLTTKEEK
ncbi:N-acetylmuramoyl-L-alanine amidase [Paenibacillus sp. FSL L8-0436]|uniref:N-acetylmuramoyl-L-alanine amidase n=1 Tax=Paenibacillus sp. FSL L8-0436 TaxID=2954686 RepID=UPI003158675A